MATELRESGALLLTKRRLEMVDEQTQISDGQVAGIDRVQAEVVEPRFEIHRIGCGNPDRRPIAGLPPQTQRAEALGCGRLSERTE